MPLLNRVILESLLLSLQCSVRAMMLLERIPDQIVLRDSEFSFNVESYFSEPALEFHVETPAFLSFSSRRLEPVDITQLPLLDTQKPLQSVAGQGQDVFVLTQELGLLVYRFQSQTRLQLLQHYFDTAICQWFQHVTISGDCLVLYNSSYVAVVDITDPLFPFVMAESELNLQVVKAVIQRSGQLLVVSRLGGVELYDSSEEAGFLLNKTWDLGPDFHPSAAEQTQTVLFVLDPVYGLRSLTLETGTLLQFNVSGQRLFLTNSTLIIDGCTVLDLQTLTTWSYPAPMSADLFTVLGDVYFYGNSTHLVAVNPVLNLTSVEERGELVDLAVVNATLLEVRKREALFRAFTPESAVLHGHVPLETGGYEVKFTARGKINSVEAHFMLIVEAPPLEVLVYLIGGSICVLFLAGLGCIIFKLAEVRKDQPSVPGMHVMSEEFTSATRLPHARQLGPMPEAN